MGHRTVSQGQRFQRPATPPAVAGPDNEFAANRDRAIARTRQCAQDYRRRFLNDDEIVVLNMVPRQSEIMVTGVKTWLLNLWKECYKRIAAIRATTNQGALDLVINDDYTSVGVPPHSMLQIMSRK